MAKFSGIKTENEYIRDKGEADKIIEVLDNKIYLFKEQLKEKDTIIENNNNLILTLQEEIKIYKKDNIESEQVLQKTHEKLKQFNKLNEKYNALKKKLCVH
jgi:hypothetical protein